ncbi:histone acetyltransferase 1 [Phlyctochytrium bullatum]|nr:histone acetyltransferase 1 [Phlyctochytrium bullatum]
MNRTIKKKGREWVHDANDALELKLVRAGDRPPIDLQRQAGEEVQPPSDDEKHRTFHPEFTYPFYGEEQVLFGYKNPLLRIHFAAGSLRTYIKFSYSARIDDEASAGPSSSDGDVSQAAKAQDVMAPLLEKLPKEFTNNYNAFMEFVSLDERSFKPMGEKIHEYSVPSAENCRYEMFRCSFKTPGFKEYHRRLQPFLIWFIEGASYIDEDDDKWEATVVYERREKPGDFTHIYSVVGYATAYGFFHYPDKKRMRISQFIILPPYQKKGHGATLYRALHRDFLVRNEVVDFGVEDPNDAFQDLRDLCDLRLLKERKAFEGVNPPVSAEAVEEVRLKFKLSKIQAQRCCEMVLMSQVDLKNKALVKEMRLQIKRRLFRHNEEVLMSMEEDKRKEKLEETYQAVVEGYRNTISAL